jgi:acetyl-CoA carboxylase biotin carboxyl carrier protein
MSQNPIDYELIRQLANILDETDLTEIEVEHDKLKIRVARTAAPVTVAQGAPGPWAYPPMPAMAPAAPVAAPVAAAAAPVAADPASNPGAVKSPMVGTAYIAPEPGAKPYVEIGEQVREGQTVMIIEAMKHLNQIPAPRAGKVTAILVDNGQPVEFGEALLIIE